MLAEASDIRENGIWAPDAALIAKMKIAVAIGKGKGGYYWQHRPGTAKSHDRVCRWLADPENTQIDEWACQKLLKAYKKTFEELSNPRHPVGDLRYYAGSVALITAAPNVNKRGELVYPAVVDGQFIELKASSIGKRAPRKKKIQE